MAGTTKRFILTATSLRAHGDTGCFAAQFSVVMPGLVPGIHAFLLRTQAKTWMAGTSPAMTERMNNQLSPGALANALSTTSPIGCQELPSNCTSRICSIGWKSDGPVFIAMPGIATVLW
jgi:hypothetical protein